MALSVKVGRASGLAGLGTTDMLSASTGRMHLVIISILMTPYCFLIRHKASTLTTALLAWAVLTGSCISSNGQGFTPEEAMQIREIAKSKRLRYSDVLRLAVRRLAVAEDGSAARDPL